MVDRQSNTRNTIPRQRLTSSGPRHENEKRVVCQHVAQGLHNVLIRQQQAQHRLPNGEARGRV